MAKPHPDRRLGSVDATYDSPVGRIVSRWRCDESGRLRWSFEIPQGATATVALPGRAGREYGSGSHEIVE